MFDISSAQLFKPWQQQFQAQVPQNLPHHNDDDIIVKINRPATQGFVVHASLNAEKHSHGGVTIPPPDLDEAITFGTQALPKSARLIRISGLSVAAGVTAYAIGHTCHDLMDMPEKFRSIKTSKAAVKQQEHALNATEEHVLLKKWYHSVFSVLNKHETEAKFDVVEKITLLIASSAMLGVILSEIPSLAFIGEAAALFAVPGIAVFGGIVIAHAIWSKINLHRASQHLKAFGQNTDTIPEDKAIAARVQQSVDLDNSYQNKFIACGLGLIFGLTPGALGIAGLVVGSVSIGLVGYWRSVAMMNDYAHLGELRTQGPSFTDLLNRYNTSQSLADQLISDRSSGWSMARSVISYWDAYVLGRSIDTEELINNVDEKLVRVLHAKGDFSATSNDMTHAEKKVAELIKRLKACDVDAYRKWGVALVGDHTLRGALSLVEDDAEAQRYMLSEEGILAAFIGRDVDTSERYLRAMYSHARDILWDHVATEYAQEAGNVQDILLDQLKQDKAIEAAV